MSEQRTHDLIIVGAGPAGLSAAVGAESEWISTLVLDSDNKLGGQAGTSSLIENFPGFPGGVTGPDLMARMIDQALSFSTEFMAPVRVDGIEQTSEGVALCENGNKYVGGAVLLACGVEYRRLRASNLAAYLGRGVSYGSPNMANTYDAKKAFVVGGANSAGQAAMHLSKFADCDVRMLVRGGRIEDKMSGYLVDRVSDNDKIEVITDTDVVAVDGNGRLEKITIKTGEEERTVDADELFILIGAETRTAWMPDEIARDQFGFVYGGNKMPGERAEQFKEVNGRYPLDHETSMPGVFVAGDLRSGSNKRVALAVGDGMEVIPELHQYRAN